MTPQRCGWVPPDNEIYMKYHDEEWGVPVHDDRVLFEFIVLESSQAGLSWSTILKKREGYRKAFHNFNVNKVARMTNTDIERLVNDPDGSIVRHRGKIESTITNAQAFMRIQDEIGSFAKYLWGFVNGAPIVNHWKKLDNVPVVTGEAKILAKDMKKRGFKFFGPTIAYAYMQAVGMVNDHTTDCFRWRELVK